MLASLASRMPIGAGWQHCVCVYIYYMYLYIYMQANGFSLYKFQAKNKRGGGGDKQKQTTKQPKLRKFNERPLLLLRLPLLSDSILFVSYTILCLACANDMPRHATRGDATPSHSPLFFVHLHDTSASDWLWLLVSSKAMAMATTTAWLAAKWGRRDRGGKNEFKWAHRTHTNTQPYIRWAIPTG